MRDSEYEFIRSLVYERSRISLGPDKRQLVMARLGKRLRATNVPTLADYCHCCSNRTRKKNSAI